MHATIDTETRLIRQVGQFCGELPGCVNEEIDDVTWALLGRASERPNRGLILAADHSTVTALDP